MPDAQALELTQFLPAEADSEGFDTVAAKQGISALHVRSYLRTADHALDIALVMGPRPQTTRTEIEYANSPYLNYFHTAKILGGGITKKVDDRVVMFFDTGSTYLLHSDSEGYDVPFPGEYRVSMDAKPYQATSPVVLTLYRGVLQGAAASLDHLIGTYDLVGEDPRIVELTTFLRPDNLLAPSVADLAVPQGPYVNYYDPDITVQDYEGEGIAIRSLTIEGPIIEQWPPAGVRRLFTGVPFNSAGELELDKPAPEHTHEVVEAFATRAFRRPLREGEAEAYANLAADSLAASA